MATTSFEKHKQSVVPWAARSGCDKISILECREEFKRRNFNSAKGLWFVLNFTKYSCAICKIGAGLSAIPMSCLCQSPAAVEPHRQTALFVRDYSTRAARAEMYNESCTETPGGHGDAPCLSLAGGTAAQPPACRTPAAPSKVLAIQDMLQAMFLQLYLVSPFLLQKSSYIKAVRVQLAQRHYSKASGWTWPCRQITGCFDFLLHLFHPIHLRLHIHFS